MAGQNTQVEIPDIYSQFKGVGGDNCRYTAFKQIRLKLTSFIGQKTAAIRLNF